MEILHNHIAVGYKVILELTKKYIANNGVVVLNDSLGKTVVKESHPSHVRF